MTMKMIIKKAKHESRLDHNNTKMSQHERRVLYMGTDHNNKIRIFYLYPSMCMCFKSKLIHSETHWANYEVNNENTK